MSDRFTRSLLMSAMLASAIAAQASTKNYTSTYKKGVYVGAQAVDEPKLDFYTGNRHPDEVKYDGSQIVSRKFNESATRMNSFVQDYCDMAIQSQLLETGNVVILDKRGRALPRVEVMSLNDDAKALLNVGAVVGEVKYTRDMSEGQLEDLKIKAANDASILVRQLSDYKKMWMDVRDNELRRERTFRKDNDEVASYVAQQNLAGSTTIWRLESLHVLSDMQRNSSAAEIRKGFPSEGKVVHGFFPAEEALNRLYMDTEWNREWRTMMSKIEQEAPQFVLRGDMTGNANRQDKEPSLFPELDQLNLQSKGKDIAQSSDLHSLNLDDPNGDWCKCEERGEKPGCEANMEASEKGYVIFGCTKCKKVNVKYAKMALSLEQKMKDAGVKGMWHGPNAEANARKAASESNK